MAREGKSRFAQDTCQKGELKTGNKRSHRFKPNNAQSGRDGYEGKTQKGEH